MGKVRSQDVKAKKQGDFSQKRVKVGRKVKRDNVTKITVKSKSVYIPTQILDDSERGSEHDRVKLMLRQLHHYSGPNRVRALDELKKFLVGSNDYNKWIALVFPEIIELIFDEEKDTRVAVISVITTIISKYI